MHSQKQDRKSRTINRAGIDLSDTIIVEAGVWQVNALNSVFILSRIDSAVCANR